MYSLNLQGDPMGEPEQPPGPQSSQPSLPPPPLKKSHLSLSKANTKVALLGFALALVISAIAFLGWPAATRMLRHSKAASDLDVMLREDAGYSETILKVELDAPDASLKEFADFCEKSITQRTERIIKIRAISPDIDSELRDRALDYLNAENSLVRAKRRFYDSYEVLSRMQTEYSNTGRLITQIESLNRGLGDAQTAARLEASIAYLEQKLSLEKGRVTLSIQMNQASTTLLKTSGEYDSAFSATQSKEEGLIAAARVQGIAVESVFGKYRSTTTKEIEKAKTSIKL
jgi:hypothetical protein